MSVAAVGRGGGVGIALGVELGHGAVGEVAAFWGGPLVMYVREDGADEADHCRFVREGPDYSAASGWTKIVRCNAATMSVCERGTSARRLRAEWTRQR